MNIFKTMLLLRKKGMYNDTLTPPAIQGIMEHDSLSTHDIGNIKKILNKYLGDIAEISQSSPHPSDEAQAAYTRISDRINHIATKDKIQSVVEDLTSFASDIKGQLNLDDLKLSVRAQLGHKLNENPDGDAKDIRALLDNYTSEELNDLSPELYLQPSLKLAPLSPLTQTKLNAYIDQHKLDKQLNALGFTQAGKMPEMDSSCQRIILTTRDVMIGLNTILTYLNATGQTFSDIESGRVTAIDIRTPLEEGSSTSTSPSSSSSPEIAWGLLSSLKKHQSDRPFVTTSFEVAGKAIPLLGASSTLVLDGNGSKVSATFADQPERASGALANMITQLINVDTGNHIDHVILQSCTSGNLRPEEDLYVKQNTAPGKGRKIIHREDENTDDLFKKMGEGKSELNTLAAVIYDAIVTRARRNDVAYTFSEHLINPSIQLDGGNVGVKPKGVGEARLPWPKSMLPNSEVDAAASAGIWKSYTIVPNAEHRKSAANLSRQIKYQYQTQKDEFKDASVVAMVSDLTVETTATTIVPVK